jgi:hypothetical protein
MGTNLPNKALGNGSRDLWAAAINGAMVNRVSLTAPFAVEIQALGPYQSLLLLGVPICLVEPAKLVALAVVGEGHWITGTAMIIAAYTISLSIVERLFRIVRPKLLTLQWFAKAWGWFLALKARLFGVQ